VQPTDGPAPRWARTSAIAAVVVLAVGLVIVAVVATTGREPPTGTAASPSRSGGTASPSAVRSESPATSVSRRSSGLTARYIPGDSSADGYEASIAIATMVPVEGWSAVLILPDGIVATMAWEADFRQDGSKLTLTPKSWNDSISRGQSVTIRFQVRGGAGQPTACSVNGVKCTK
jgi:hypothetical protein